MTRSAARELPGRERRQFRLLLKASRRRLMENLAFSRDADPRLFLLWAGVLVTMPVLVMSTNRVIRFGMAQGSPAPPEVVARLITSDRLFFVLYAMLAAALLAALLWDALFPDRLDQEIVGVLPVRPRTLAGARLAAAAMAGLTLAGALSIPASLFFGFAQAMLPGTAPMPRLIVAHAVSTAAATMAVFLSLMTIRGVVAIIAGERIAARIAVALQLITVVGFVEGFLLLPGVLANLGRHMHAGFDGIPSNPILWFAGMYWWLAGTSGTWGAAALTAAAVTVGAALAVVILSLAPAAWMGRRVLETSTRERAGGYMILARRVASVVMAPPPVRGMFLFAIASLMRSRRHALVLASYLGLAIATSAVGLISAGYAGRLTLAQPTVAMLTVPMVLVFFMVFGLKAAFGIPTDVDANWPFRLAAPSAGQAVATARLLMYVLGLTPIVGAWALTSLSMWRPSEALLSAGLVLVSGAALVEFALGSWTKVPFASAHEPAASTMKTKWFFYAFFLHVYGFLLAFGQLAALRSTGAALRYVGFFAAVTVALRVLRERRLRRQELTLDPDDDATVVLNLSEASS